MGEKPVKKTIKGNPHRCQNCDLLWAEEDIKPLGEVKDLLQRITPGEEVPSGECPECGHLTHVLDLNPRIGMETAIIRLDSTIKTFSTKADQIIAEMKKKNHLEAKRLDFNKMREWSDAIRTIASMGKEGALPQELIANLIEKFGAKQRKKKEQEKEGKKDEDSKAGGS